MSKVYQRLSAVLFPIVTLLLVGAALWGYQEHQDKNRILVKAENQYQRAFHDLSYHVDQLHEELGNTLAVSSSSNFHRKGLVNLWRLTNQAQSEVNQLPLTLMPFNETEQLLANISKFSYNTAVRDLKQNPLTDSEMKVLNTLYKQSKDIKDDLRKVQQSVLANHLQWMDVETILASGKENYDNDIIDGFKLMNKRVTEFGDIDWGPSISAMNRRYSMKSLSGPMVSAEQVKQKAATFLNVKNTASLKVTENGANTDFPTYSVSFPDRNGNVQQVEYTKKGGKMLYYIATRDVKQRKLSIPQAAKKAESFLRKNGYDGMRAIAFDEYNNIASISFAKVIDGVTVYPEKATVKVMLDNGQIGGLTAGDMLYAGSGHSIGKPGMPEAEARKMLNPNFTVEKSSLALIRNDSEEEVLCYEYEGSINGGDYRIYINADTGFEEKIEHFRKVQASA